MTDRPTTNEDLKMTLAQIEETLQQAADPQSMLDPIGAQLGVLFNNAEAANDAAAMTSIQTAWENAQHLANAARVNKEAALSMADLAGTFQNQRDNALKELEELSDAVSYMDTDHPQVAELLESFQEAIDEEDAYWYDERVENTIFEQLQDVFKYDADYEPHINIFLEIFRVNLEVLPARKREFYAWLDAVKADNESGDDDDE